MLDISHHKTDGCSLENELIAPLHACKSYIYGVEEESRGHDDKITSSTHDSSSSLQDDKIKGNEGSASGLMFSSVLFQTLQAREDNPPPPRESKVKSASLKNSPKTGGAGGLYTLDELLSMKDEDDEDMAMTAESMPPMH